MDWSEELHALVLAGGITVIIGLSTVVFFLMHQLRSERQRHGVDVEQTIVNDEIIDEDEDQVWVPPDEGGAIDEDINQQNGGQADGQIEAEQCFPPVEPDDRADRLSEESHQIPNIVYIIDKLGISFAVPTGNAIKIAEFLEDPEHQTRDQEIPRTGVDSGRVLRFYDAAFEAIREFTIGDPDFKERCKQMGHFLKMCSEASNDQTLGTESIDTQEGGEDLDPKLKELVESWKNAAYDILNLKKVHKPLFWLLGGAFKECLDGCLIATSGTASIGPVLETLKRNWTVGANYHNSLWNFIIGAIMENIKTDNRQTYEDIGKLVRLLASNSEIHVLGRVHNLLTGNTEDEFRVMFAFGWELRGNIEIVENKYVYAKLEEGNWTIRPDLLELFHPTKVHESTSIEPQTATANNLTKKFSTIGVALSQSSRTVEGFKDPLLPEKRIQSSMEKIVNRGQLLRQLTCENNEEKLEMVKKSCEELYSRENRSQLLRQLTLENNKENLEMVKKSCEELYSREYNKWDDLNTNQLSGFLKVYRPRNVIKTQLEQNYIYKYKIMDIMREQLNVNLNMINDDVRLQELSDVILYYLLRGERPHEHVQFIILMLFFDPQSKYLSGNWYGLCCAVLGDKQRFDNFYEQLDKDKDKRIKTLAYIVCKQPEILMNRESGALVEKLMRHLPYVGLRSIISTIRDESGQTCMFHVDEYEPYLKLYHSQVDDLYELLSIRNESGQTALHVNTLWITRLLAEMYNPKQRDASIKLTSISDNHNETALQGSNDDYLRSFIRRVENNEYIMSSRFSTKMLMIYTTNNRPGASKEVEAACNAVKSTYGNEKMVEIYNDKNKKEIIDLINCAAQNCDDVLPTSMIVILASFGNVGTIDDCDGNPIKLSEIEEAMCSGIMDGKPKMLITQCCRTEDKFPDTRPAYAPTHDDFCAVMSCVAGQKSTIGIFLTELAAQVGNSEKNTNIFKLVNNVSREMERARHPQTPIILSTLKAGFCPTDDWWYTD